MKKRLILAATCILTGCTIQTPSSINPDNEQTFDVYFYIPDDNGINGELIGCGDSLSAMQNTVYTDDDPLRSAINALLTVENEMVQAFGLDNALAQSNLTIDYIQDNNTYTIIALVGDIIQNGSCDSPRITGQLVRTAGQFFPNNNFIILINGLPLDESLSEK